VNKTDTERLVRKAAVLDNRHVNDAVIDAWHELVGHLSYEVGERSLRIARQDPNIAYLEPKHLLGKSRDAIVELNTERAKAAQHLEDEGPSDPEPRCRAHVQRITSCLECCQKLFRSTQFMRATEAHAWAVENLYDDAF
jgi:hypothetical protein